MVTIVLKMAKPVTTMLYSCYQITDDLRATKVEGYATVASADQPATLRLITKGAARLRLLYGDTDPDSKPPTQSLWHKELRTPGPNETQFLPDPTAADAPVPATHASDPSKPMHRSEYLDEPMIGYLLVPDAPPLPVGRPKSAPPPTLHYPK